MKIVGMTEEEARPYIEYIEKKYGRKLTELELEDHGDYVDIIGGKFEVIPFQRIRRITGYLVQDVSEWVGSKQAEEKARVKHGGIL